MNIDRTHEVREAVMGYVDPRVAAGFEVGVGGYLEDGPTRRQRHALYRFGVSRKRVQQLTKAQASALLDVLIGSIPRTPYERTQAPAGRVLEQ
jgi:hypothetical protein